MWVTGLSNFINKEKEARLRVKIISVQKVKKNEKFNNTLNLLFVDIISEIYF